MENFQELKNKIEKLEKIRTLNNMADDALEEAIQQRLSLSQTLEKLFPLLADALNAKSIFVKTFDENLMLKEFYWGSSKSELFEKISDSKEEQFSLEGNGEYLSGQSFDVAGEWFGLVSVVSEFPHEDIAFDLINVWSEELDNFLASIAQARMKHKITHEIADCLTQSVLEDGINGALEILKQNVEFDDMILVYFNSESLTSGVHYKIIIDGQLKYDSYIKPDQEIDKYLHDHFEKGKVSKDELAQHFNLDIHVEEMMITGIFRQQDVGRVIVARKSREFNTFDRDLLDIFSTYLRQRVVDFNREWKNLSSSFCPSVVHRLMAEDNYTDKYLTPKEYPVAIMYTDISGFTRISETVLKKPALIGKLIDHWSKEVVKIIWDTGGVFDKLVGDCVIGLWGPPFQNISAEQACMNALSASQKIKAFTASLNDGKAIPELEGLETGVSTGLSYCSLFVGQFGPNNSYTGFSSGMNNTARLQGLANFQQILCMHDFVNELKDQKIFGAQESAQVKNVSEPILFHELLQNTP